MHFLLHCVVYVYSQHGLFLMLPPHSLHWDQQPMFIYIGISCVDPLFTVRSHTSRIASSYPGKKSVYTAIAEFNTLVCLFSPPPSVTCSDGLEDMDFTLVDKPW